MLYKKFKIFVENFEYVQNQKNTCSFKNILNSGELPEDLLK